MHFNKLTRNVFSVKDTLLWPLLLESLLYLCKRMMHGLEVGRSDLGVPTMAENTDARCNSSPFFKETRSLCLYVGKSARQNRDKFGNLKKKGGFLAFMMT